MGTQNFITLETFWDSITQEQKETAIKEGQFFICKVKDCNYKTLPYGVFDPSLDDLFHLIAMFRDIKNAEEFIRCCL
jgi:hypothetical protein